MWLVVDPDVVAHRIAASPWRPKVQGRREAQVADEVRTSMRARAHALAAAALTIDATTRDVADLTEEILGAIEPRP